MTDTRARANPSIRSVAIALLALVILLEQPSIAQANVGTPLMWATMLHMVIGNACIGILEGMLLAWVYRVPAGKAVGLMILANYFSAWVGWTSLAEMIRYRNDVTLDNVGRYVAGMIATAYVVTLWLEWPFVAISVWGAGHNIRRSCAASLLVQSVSYALLFGWYGMASANSLLTDTTIVPADQISVPSNVRIYFIADDDGDVYSRESSTGKTEKVFDLNSTDSMDCLGFDVSPASNGPQQIVVLQKSGDDNHPKLIPIGVTVSDEACPRDENNRLLQRYRFLTPSMGDASRLGEAVNSPWKFHAGFWAIEGLSAENTKTGEHFRCALEVPFVQWPVRNAIALPSNRVLFQLGQRQICVLDAETRRVALIGLGRGALAVLEPAPSPPNSDE